MARHPTLPDAARAIITGGGVTQRDEFLLHGRGHMEGVGVPVHFGDGETQGTGEKSDAENQDKGHRLGKKACPAHAKPADQPEREKTVDAGDDNGEREPDRESPEEIEMETSKNADADIDVRNNNEAVDQARLQGVAEKPRGEDGAGR